MKHFIAALPVLLIILANCSPMKSLDQIPDSQKLLSYERTPCFGFCPTYRIDILPDGRALFVGRQYVPVQDTVELTIPDAILNRVTAILRHPEYLEYQLEEPDYHVTDLPGLLFTDYSNDKNYELDMVIPPAVEKITDLIDEELTRQELIYDNSIYPDIKEEILVELKPGTDPASIKHSGQSYELEYLKEVGSGIHLYSIRFSILERDKALNEVYHLKGVRNAQFNHRLQRR